MTLSEVVYVDGLPMTRGAAWILAHEAAESRGAPDPRACADRYLQGLDTIKRTRADKFTETRQERTH